MHTGAANRKLASTSTNTGSNRSHSIMTVTVECSEELESKLSRVTVGQLALVDLASGEGPSPSSSSMHMDGTQLTNQAADDPSKSLATLIRVINKVCCHEMSL